jgi:light-regulated signal transduction histidine kinase (bacteriophytochrome)
VCLYESLTDFHQFSKDNGPGIAEKYHQKYLKFFKQLKPDKREYRRWVVIVQKIIEEQGGTIRIESAAGQGASLFYNS